MKFLVNKIGIEAFLQLVEQEKIAIKNQKFHVEEHEIPYETAIINTKEIPSELTETFEKWKKNNVFAQKQNGFFAVGVKITIGDIHSDKARLLADIIELYTGNDTRITVAQSFLLRFVPQQNLPALFLALNDLGLAKIGFHKINDIVACPGTDTCNLGIASAMGLAKELERVIEEEFSDLIEDEELSIKISGCMNACGQHTIANIGFQGMTIKSGNHIAPASQVLLGGGIIGDGQGRFADKVLKVPSKRTPQVLRWILNDFQTNKQENENFLSYYDRQGEDYFYQNLKEYSNDKNLEESDFIDWGNEQKYEKAIGVGECAGVMVDLVQTLFFEADDKIVAVMVGDQVYGQAAKALLTSKQVACNSQANIIETFDKTFPEFAEKGSSFADLIYKINKNQPSETFAQEYFNQAVGIVEQLKSMRE